MLPGKMFLLIHRSCYLSLELFHLLFKNLVNSLKRLTVIRLIRLNLVDCLFVLLLLLLEGFFEWVILCRDSLIDSRQSFLFFFKSRKSTIELFDLPIFLFDESLKFIFPSLVVLLLHVLLQSSQNRFSLIVKRKRMDW